MITHFPKNPMMNIGGVSSFYYIPVYQIASLPAITGKLITKAVQCAAGYYLLDGYSTLEELDFKETAKSDPNGTYYEWELVGFVPGSSDELISIMEDMEQVRHLVIIRDNTNQQRLVGYGSPLDFNAVYQSGGKPGEARGYKYTFSGSGIKRAPIYRL